MGSSGPAVCHPRLGVVPQSGCIGPWAFVIGPSGGGGRRRGRRASHHGGHRPRRGVDDTPDNAHLHRSTGPTPRTAGATDRHHTTEIIDYVPSRASTTARSVESVRQPGAPAVHPLRCPIRQRSCARVLGLDGQAEPLSSGDGRGGAVPRKVKTLGAWPVTYPTKGCTLDVQTPRKSSTKVPNLSKDEICFNFSLSISI
jgi:hypothetical protein